MAQPPSLNLSWLGGGVGGLLRGGRDTNAGGSVYGGQRNLGKEFLEGVGTATDEQFASDSKKARSLRQYLSEVDPSLKDQVQAMGLGDLEGKALTLARKRMDAEQNQKSQAEYLRMLATADEINARRRAEAGQAAGESALGRYMQALGQPVPPEGLQAPGFTPQGAALQAAGPDLAKAPAASLRAFADFMPEAVGSPAQWDVNKEAVPGMSLVAKRGSQVWQAFPSGGEPQTATVRDANGLPYTVIQNPKTGSVTPVGSGSATLTAAQAEDAYAAALKRRDALRLQKRLAAKDPEAAQMWGGADADAAMAEAEADVQRFDALRKRGSGAAAAAPASGGVTIKSIKQIR